MKRNLLLLLLAISLHIHAKETILTLKFSHAKKESVLLYPPIDYQPCFATDTIPVIKNDSVYRIPVKIDRPAFMNIAVKGGKYITVLLQPGQLLELTYDCQSPEPYSFSGDNAIGQKVLNELLQSKDPYQFEWIRDYMKAPLDTVPEKLEANFRKMEQAENERIDSLYRIKAIDRKFRDFLSKTIQMYYLSTLSRIARNACQTVNKEAFYIYWEKLYREYPVEKQEASSEWFLHYANLYVEDFCQAREMREGKKTETPQTLAEYYSSYYRMYHERVADKKLRELLLGNKLYMLALNNKTNSTEILPCFDRFKQEYPDNNYSFQLDKFANKVLFYQKKIKNDFAPEVRFLAHREELKNLKDVFARFKGKAVFIDFWFSTCGPCRDQFTYAKPLKEFLKQHGIELLYISIDDDTMEENWKNSIKYFDLYGWHLRALRALHTDMHQNYGIRLYPTYMLINKEGDIVLERAKDPSEKEALYEQIQKSLHLP